MLYFNPLSLYRERRREDRAVHVPDHISIHSPYTGRDSRRGKEKYEKPYSISIHSPYTGRDYEETELVWDNQYFNPLSLYRERRTVQGQEAEPVKFQSTLPIQGETLGNTKEEMLCIHFNPLSLYRERLKERHFCT